MEADADRAATDPPTRTTTAPKRPSLTAAYWRGVGGVVVALALALLALLAVGAVRIEVR